MLHNFFTDDKSKRHHIYDNVALKKKGAHFSRKKVMILELVVI